MGACVCRGKLDGGKLNRVIDRKYWGLSLRRSLDAGSRRQLAILSANTIYTLCDHDGPKKNAD